MDPVAIAPCAVMGVVGLIVLAIALGAGARRRRREFMQRFAAQLGGNVLSNDPFGNPTLHWNARGVAANLQYHYGSKNRHAFTQIHFQWTPAGSLRITPEGMFTGLRKFFGTQDIQVGYAEFDRRFLIQGSPDPWVAESLYGPVRDLITRLANLGELRLEAGPPGVTIQVGTCLMETAQFGEFIELAGALLEEFVGHAHSGGIQIVTADLVAAAGKCPVCGGDMDEHLRRCSSCRTPHHDDCWEYFGGCAIFGCASRKGTKVRERAN